MSEVVVTGSSGFVGSNLCRRLVNAGHDVVGVDIAPPEFELPDAVDTRTLDLRADSDLPPADAIVHLAAHSQVQPVVAEPERAVENVAMTNAVLAAADRTDAFVVNASSRDVYGTAIRPSEAAVTPDSPNGYAASKLGSEALASAYRTTHDVPSTSVRLANVYGPRDANRRVIPIFVARALAGKELVVYGRGKLLDFVHVDDVCDAFGTILDRPAVADGRTFNLGSGTGTPLSTVAATIAERVDACPGWRVSDDRAGDVGQYVSDVSTARAVLDFEPTVSLEAGLSETVEWYRERPDLRERILSAGE